MTIKEFIETAIEGGYFIKSEDQLSLSSGVQTIEGERIVTRREKDGWKETSYLRVSEINFYKLILDSEAWKAVGKVKGWVTTHGTMEDSHLSKGGLNLLGMHMEYSYNEGGAVTYDIETWKMKMLEMSFYLAKGKTLEEFLQTL